jgi:hypothetical protein
MSAALYALTRSPPASHALEGFAGCAPAEPASLFDEARLNVVIIGAGPIGLALASALKLSLRTAVNVLIVDNRLVGPHRKAPYTRHWLTAVTQDGVRDLADDALNAIFGRLGSARPGKDTRCIGVPLDMLETLLLASCRRMGVKLLFADGLDWSFVQETPVDLVFDASGNRLDPTPWPASVNEVTEVRTHPLSEAQLNVAELETFGVAVDPYARFRSLTLGMWRGIGLPIFMNQILRLAMIKITRVPIRLYRAILDHVAPRNVDSRFYVWPGLLHEAVNQVLILINLEKAEYEHLCRTFTYPLRVEEAVQSHDFRTGVDPRFVDLLRLIVELATPAEREQIALDAPFLFRPYFRETREPERFAGKPLIRIGDSVYNGHAKAGNGLAAHLSSAAALARNIWHAFAIAHATDAGAAMAAPRV